MNEPIFRIPGTILVLAGLFIGIHGLSSFLDAEAYTQFIYTFAFFPARYDTLFPWPGGLGSKLWTFITYAFLHADWMHVTVNTLWLVAFGTPVARRFGTSRLVFLALLCAISGALFHLVTNLHSAVPMLGASAIVSGLMGAASRFIFASNGSLDPFRNRAGNDNEAYQVPAIPLSRMLYSRQVVFFLGIWLIINFVLGISAVFAGESQSIAWQAHIGGFLAGILLFDIIDPYRSNGGMNNHA